MSEQANIISPDQPQQFQLQCSTPQMDGQIITQEQLQTGKEQSCKGPLQHFTQKAKLPLPSYRTTQDQQSLKFRSSVEVDGETFTCLTTFSTRKAAEEAAAKLALESESISEKIKKIKIEKIKNRASQKSNDGEFPPIHKDRVFCKSILHEYATKKNLDKPTYDTIRVDTVVPLHVSSFVFDGVKYTGEPSGSKKEAEQLAARAAILSVLANSGSETILSDIVRSKAKFISALHANSSVTNLLHFGSDTGTSVIKEIASDNVQRGGDMTRNVSTDELQQQSASKKARIPENATESCIVIGNVSSTAQQLQSPGPHEHGFREPNLETLPQPSLLPWYQTLPQPSFLPQPSLLQSFQTLPQPSLLPITQTLPQPSLLPITQTLPQPSLPPNTQTQSQPSLHPSTQILPQPSLLANSHALPQPTFIPSFITQIPSNESAASRRRKNKKANKAAKNAMQMQASNVPLSLSSVLYHTQ